MKVKARAALVFLTIILLLVACSAPARPSGLDDTPRVLVMSALGAELSTKTVGFLPFPTVTKLGPSAIMDTAIDKSQRGGEG